MTTRRHFTYLFNRRGAGALADRAKQQLDRVWGSRLTNVAPGDRIYVIAVRDGQLQLVCRFEAIQCISELAEIKGRSTPIILGRSLPIEVSANLRFLRRGTSQPPVFRHGRFDPQTLRGVRELTLESAQSLDRWIDRGASSSSTDRPMKMRALSVRQPWAELILRGTKSIEVRSRPTRVRERVFLYASPIRIDEEIERAVHARYRVESNVLLRGQLVGTVEVTGCRPLALTDSEAACFPITNPQGHFAWHLANPLRSESPAKPLNRPQPVWFYPF